jgi:polygalacturonase
MPPLQRPVFAVKVFDIRDYGAMPGGAVANTEAIARAVAACHATGGGTVVIPAGAWLTGPVHLKSGVNLEVRRDAELVFSDHIPDYLPAVESAWEGFACYNYSPLIYAADCENIGLTGKGKLVCRREGWSAWDGRPPSHLDALRTLHHAAADNVPVKDRQMANDRARLRPPFIEFLRCRHVLIEGLTIRNSPFWAVHPLQCENVIVRDLDICCRGHNTDGIDPDQTRNMLIEDCVFDQGDDAIVIKAGSNQDGWRGRSSENIVIRNCTIKQGHNLLAVGSELSGGVRNVYLHDCTFDYAGGWVRSCLLIKTNHRRGGVIENIYIRNAHCDKVTSALLEIDTDVLYQWRDLAETRERRPTTIRNICLENVSVGEAQHGLLVKGDPELPVRDITLKNVRADHVLDTPRELSNVEGLKEEQVVFSGSAHPARPVVLLIGDSTVTEHEGWGRPFACRFSQRAEVLGTSRSAGGALRAGTTKNGCLRLWESTRITC